MKDENRIIARMIGTAHILEEMAANLEKTSNVLDLSVEAFRIYDVATNLESFRLFLIETMPKFTMVAVSDTIEHSILQDVDAVLTIHPDILGECIMGFRDLNLPETIIMDLETHPQYITAKFIAAHYHSVNLILIVKKTSLLNTKVLGAKYVGNLGEAIKYIKVDK